MKKLMAALSATLVLAGCSSPQPESTPPPTVGHEPFLPAYLEMLQGKQSFPADHCHSPRNLQELLIPCDVPGQ